MLSRRSRLVALAVGSTYAGRLSDHLVVSWRKKRGGVWVPEDRLRATTFGGLVLAPLSIIGSGLVTEFADDSLNMMLLNFFFLFLNGVGVRSSVSYFSGCPANS